MMYKYIYLLLLFHLTSFENDENFIFQRGIKAFNKHDYKEAITIFNSIPVPKNGYHSKIYFYIACCYYNMGVYQYAETFAYKSLNGYPKLSFYPYVKDLFIIINKNSKKFYKGGQQSYLIENNFKLRAIVDNFRKYYDPKFNLNRHDTDNLQLMLKFLSNDGTLTRDDYEMLYKLEASSDKLIIPVENDTSIFLYPHHNINKHIFAVDSLVNK